MPAEGIAGPHLVRYGTAADQKFLIGPFASTYDQLVINANMLAHIPAALATLVTQHARKPFFIDPQTHAFQQPAEHLRSAKTGAVKKSIASLVEAYGTTVSAPVLRGESVLPEDFGSDSAVAEFCSKVLDFQQYALKAEVEESDDAKYYEFLEEETGSASFSSVAPALLVAPYFYLRTSTFREWLPVNVACAEAAIAEGRTRGVPTAVQVVLSQDVLRSNLEQVVAAYQATKPACFLVWVDDLNEHETSVEMLRRLVELFTALGGIAPVVNLYGGYFSIALMHTGRVASLAGVTHSLEYGESRAVVPVGGGVPVAKFYLPPTHARLVTRHAVRAIQTLGAFRDAATFYDRICGCAECRSIVRSDPERDFAAYGETTPKVVRGRRGDVTREYPTTQTKEHCVRHYMWAKQQEYAETAGVAATCTQLRDIAQQLKRPLGDDVGHCRVWADVLEQ